VAWILALLLAAFLTGGTATAQKKPAATAFAEGQRQYKKSNYEAAIKAFNRSFKLHPHFLTLCNLARCYERLSDMVQASQHYRRCLEEGGANAPQSAAIREAFKNVTSQLAVITIESPGTVPAEAFVDGKPVGKTPVEVPMNPGTHEIEVRRPGARPERTIIEAQIGATRTVSLQTAAQQSGSSTDAKTGADTGTNKTKGLSPVWFWTGVGITAGLAITGTILGILTLGANTDYEDDPTEEGYNRVIDRKLVTNVVWGLTAGFAVGTATVFFFTDLRGPSAEDGEDNRAYLFGIQGTF
jgi:hypothetical protein